MSSAAATATKRTHPAKRGANVATEVEVEVVKPTVRDELQELMDQSVQSQLLGVGEMIAGQRLVPVTMAYITLLKELGTCCWSVVSSSASKPWGWRRPLTWCLGTGRS